MKKPILILFSFLLVLCLVGCGAAGPRSTLEGVVTDVYEGSLLMDTEIGLCSVTLPNGDYDLSVGDRVIVTFNGEIAESYPMQIHHVYDIERVEISQAITQ